MYDYRLYQLDAKGRIKGAIELQAEDDEKAVAQVAALPVDGDVELWSRDRIVRAFPKDGSAQVHT
jgi:hypothetical protein